MHAEYKERESLCWVLPQAWYKDFIIRVKKRTDEKVYQQKHPAAEKIKVCAEALKEKRKEEKAADVIPI